MAKERKSTDPVVSLLRQVVVSIDAGCPWQQPALKAAFQLKMRGDLMGFEVVRQLMTKMAHNSLLVRTCVQNGLEAFERRTGCSTTGETV